jgi:hypothetical protein
LPGVRALLHRKLASRFTANGAYEGVLKCHTNQQL